MSMMEDKKTIKPDVGLDEENLEGLNIILARSLANEVTLQYKTKKFHWNVTGKDFQQLHELFDEQYNQLSVIADDLAEYIRQYGQMAPGTFTEFEELATIKGKPGYNPKASEMIATLVSDHEEIIRQLREDSQTAVNKYDDIQVEDLLIGLIHKHQKMAWFLRAHLEGEE